MNTVLVNLPHQKPMMRRYVASYNAPNFMIPPLELMSLGAVIKDWKHGSVTLIDAMAESMSLEALIERLRSLEPTLLVTMTGFRIFPDDVACLASIRAALPDLSIVCFGHLPTAMPEEVLENAAVDAILMGEPELTLAELYDRISAEQSWAGIRGLAYKEDGAVVVNEPRERISDLDALPFPDLSLIDVGLYNESFLGRPIAVTLTARGCPFRCAYCVRTFGDQTVYRSAQNVLAELQQIVEQHDIRNIRFLDDTFTARKPRLLEICNGILEGNLDIRWTCLTRVDSLDEEMLDVMRRSGCQRMYVGIESGSQRILDYYNKGYDVDTIRDRVRLIKASGIEASGFFIVGAPIETEDDLEQSIQLAKELDFDYIIVTKLQFWPGTRLFDRIREQLNFGLFPYVNELKDAELESRCFAWEKKFYRRFYLRPTYVLKSLGRFITTPGDILTGLRKLWSYVRSDARILDDDFI